MQRNSLSANTPAQGMATKATLAMCPPDHFDVTYQINPWMDLETWAAERETWRAKAMAEWTALKALYETLGHTVHIIAPSPGLPDMVFTANCAAVLDGKAVLARFRHAERQGEEPYYQAFFQTMQNQGVVNTLDALPKDIAFEGCGDALWDVHRQLFWIGHSQRTSARAPELVSAIHDAETVPLELVTDRFYHLDVALAPLSGGEVVYVPDAFSPEGRALIESRVAKDQRIEATQEDAELFAVNLVNIGNDIILSGASAQLQQRLESAGYRLHFVATDAFQLGGGSVFCLTQRLDHARVDHTRR